MVSTLTSRTQSAAVTAAKKALVERLRDDARRVTCIRHVLFTHPKLSPAAAVAVADCKRWLSGFAAQYAEDARKAREIVPGSDLWQLTMSQAVAEDVERHFARKVASPAGEAERTTGLTELGQRVMQRVVAEIEADGDDEGELAPTGFALLDSPEGV